MAFPSRREQPQLHFVDHTFVRDDARKSSAHNILVPLISSHMEEQWVKPTRRNYFGICPPLLQYYAHLGKNHLTFISSSVSYSSSTGSVSTSHFGDPCSILAICSVAILVFLTDFLLGINDIFCCWIWMVINPTNRMLVNKTTFLSYNRLLLLRTGYRYYLHRIKGDLATPSWTFSFWRITHFEAAISRIVRCTLVNIIISYLNIKKWPYITIPSRPANFKRWYFIFESVFKRPGNLKQIETWKTRVLNFLGVR